MREYVQLSTSVVPGKQVALQNDLRRRDIGASPDARRLPGLRGRRPALPGADHRRAEGPRGQDRVLQPAADRRYGDLFLPVDSTFMGAGMGPMTMMAPTDAGTVTDGVRNPMCTQYPKDELVLHGQPRHPAPARRHHPLDQRRLAAPVDHPGQRDHRLAAGRQRAERPRHGRRRQARRRAGLLDSPTDGCMTFYYTNQQSARLMFYHDHAWGITRLNVYAGEAAGYMIRDSTEQALINNGIDPLRPDPADHPGPDFRPAGRPACRAGPDLGLQPLGRLRQPLVPPRLHAGSEPRRPDRREHVRPLVVRPVVLAARHRRPYGPIANPYYNKDPNTNFTRSATPCNWTIRAPGSTRPTRSASRRRSRARRTTRPAWSSSTTRRWSTARPIRPRRWIRRPTGSAS